MGNEVIRFYNAARQKWPVPTREWDQLHPQEQMMMVQAINMMLQVLNNQG